MKTIFTPRLDARMFRAVTALLLFALILPLQNELSAQKCSVDSTAFDWDTTTWNSGTTLKTYFLPYMIGVDSIDVTFEIVANDSVDIIGGTPQIDPAMGGNHGSDSDLELQVAPQLGKDFRSPIEIKLCFEKRVQCLAFDISDIDGTDIGASFKDSVVIIGNRGASPSISFLAGDSTFTIQGNEMVAIGPPSGPNNNGEVDGGDDEGTARVSFGGASLDTVTILYLNGDVTSQPSDRAIALFANLSFSANSLLPVDLLSYDVERDEDCQPMIKWTTTNEYDLEYYAIEYSYDGINFSNAAIVQPKNNYDQINNYEQKLERKLNTHNYFRLVKRELDGSEEILALEVLDGRSCHTVNGVHVYPNPVYRDDFYLEVESSQSKSSNIAIFDQSGKLISESQYQLQEGNNWFKVSSKSFRPGTYFVQFRSAEEVVTRKVHVIK